MHARTHARTQHVHMLLACGAAFSHQQAAGASSQSSPPPPNAIHAAQVSRWHAPEVLAGMARLAVAQETRAAACRAAWASFLSGGARTPHGGWCRADTAMLLYKHWGLP